MHCIEHHQNSSQLPDSCLKRFEGKKKKQKQSHAHGFIKLCRMKAQAMGLQNQFLFALDFELQSFLASGPIVVKNHPEIEWVFNHLAFRFDDDITFSDAKFFRRGEDNDVKGCYTRRCDHGERNIERRVVGNHPATVA